MTELTQGSYSGVAWALSISPADVIVVTSWDKSGRLADKVPSVLTYNDECQVSSWGCNLAPQGKHISWFKLLLSEHATEIFAKNDPERLKELQSLLSYYHKKPVDVVADYLGYLWQHATAEISKSLSVLWGLANLKIVLTVPAMWDMSAQELTKEAARMAGLLNRRNTFLELVAEPEAAALSVLNHKASQNLFKVHEPKIHQL
jgi:molecular chaperone DnaK (HSP70)